MKSISTRFLIIAVLLFAVALLVTGCAPGHPRFDVDERPADFLWGVWHGWIAPFSLIGGFFNPAIRIYEPYNTGWWYDFGFYLAIVGGFGGFSLVRRRGDRP